MTREPVALTGLLTAAITASLGLAVLFGVNLSPEQIGGIVTTLGAWMGVATFIIRSQVTPLADPKDAQGQPLVPDPDAAP